MYKIGDILPVSEHVAVANWCNNEIKNKASTRMLDNGLLEIIAVPEPTDAQIADSKRAERNALLQWSDGMVSVPDWPIASEQRELIIVWRQYLRDLPALPDFPNVPVLNFEQWLETRE